MGIFDKVVGAVASGADFVVKVGDGVVTAAVDLDNMTVSIAKSVWKQVPGEALAPGLGPLAGLLKTEFEDDAVILAGPLGIMANVSVFPVQFDQAATLIIGTGALLSLIKHRRMNDREWEMASWLFGGQLPPRDNIVLTNMGSPIDLERAMVFPTVANTYYVNMADDYNHNHTIENGPLLMHELTHVWQLRNKVLRDLQIFAALNREYDYLHGSQWQNYGIEQQAEIVEDFTRGTVNRGENRPGVGPLSISSPLFRYIHSNIRTNDNSRSSTISRSIRALAGTPTGNISVRRIHSRSPQVWWA